MLMRRNITGISLFLCLFYSVQLYGERTRVTVGHSDLEKNHERPFNSEIIRLLSLGEWQSSTTLMWMTAVLDQFKEKKGNFIGHPRFYYWMKNIIEIDPYCFEAYSIGAQTLSVVHDDIKGAFQLTENGIEFAEGKLPHLPAEFAGKYWSQSWRLYFIGFYLNLIEGNDFKSAKKIGMRLISIGQAPQFFGPLIKRLSTIDGQFQVAENVLGLTREMAYSDQMRDLYDQKLRALRIKKYLFNLNLQYKSALKHGMSFDDFKSANLNGSIADPYGGTLGLNSKNRIVSSEDSDIIKFDWSSQ